ncbi:hypothetical protein LCGC14_1958630, partial [marine sediment metagenome]
MRFRIELGEGTAAGSRTDAAGRSSRTWRSWRRRSRTRPDSQRCHFRRWCHRRSARSRGHWRSGSCGWGPPCRGSRGCGSRGCGSRSLSRRRRDRSFLGCSSGPCSMPEPPLARLNECLVRNRPLRPVFEPDGVPAQTRIELVIDDGLATVVEPRVLTLAVDFGLERFPIDLDGLALGGLELRARSSPAVAAGIDGLMFPEESGPSAWGFSHTWGFSRRWSLTSTGTRTRTWCGFWRCSRTWCCLRTWRWSANLGSWRGLPCDLPCDLPASESGRHTAAQRGQRPQHRELAHRFGLARESPPCGFASGHHRDPDGLEWQAEELRR